MRSLAVATALFCIFTIFTVNGAPAAGVEDTLRAMQEQIETLQKELQESRKKDSGVEVVDKWQPSKRMVAWQPMKRSNDERAPLVHAIESRLQEVLRAGERLGVSAEEVLADLKYRNQMI